jgi:hypothetical protein
VDAYTPLCKLYVLCTKLIDMTSRNLVVGAMHANMMKWRADVERRPSTAAIKYAYDNTKEGDKLRELLVDSYRCFGVDGWIKGEEREKCPKAFSSITR